MAQRSVEIMIGRLITDEALRAAFLRDPGGLLSSFADEGHPLTSVEIAALRATPADLWQRTADAIDPRLQKADLEVPLRIKRS